jgi:heme/copper-type cytochrome/quinol oxidase subunit 2
MILRPCNVRAAILGALIILAALPAKGLLVHAFAGEDVQRATMFLDNYFFEPKHLIVRAGVPVELTLTSRTTFTPHSFVLKDPAAGLSIEQEVPAGKTVVVRFTPHQRGTFTFYCDKKLLFFKSHREKGAEGRLEVQ